MKMMRNFMFRFSDVVVFGTRHKLNDEKTDVVVFGTKHKLNDEKTDVVVFGTKHKLNDEKTDVVVFGTKHKLNDEKTDVVVFGTKHKLNDEKTDVVVFGTKHKLPLMKDIRITIGEVNFKLSSNVRILGVVFDSSLCMTNHISSICRTAYMHLHNISRIRRYPTIDATKLLVHAFVMSRLDYGNELLASLPLVHLNKLQRIQNMAARMITFTSCRDHINPILEK